MKKTEVKKVQPKKKQLKESIWHDVMQMWNDNTIPHGDGGINMSPHDTLATIAGTLLGITGTSILYLTWDKIVKAFKAAPDAARKFLQAIKVVKTSSPAEVQQNLQSQGINVNLQESAKRFHKIREIKSLVEKIEKESGFKVAFGAKLIKEETTPDKAKFDGVAKDTPHKAIENWLSGKLKKGPEPKKAMNVANDIIKSLKASGFEIVKASKVETTPTQVKNG